MHGTEKTRILFLARQLLERIQARLQTKEGKALTRFEQPDRLLVPYGLLALNGDGPSLGAFREQLLAMADEGWGVPPRGQPPLDVAFRLRNVIPAYKAVCGAGMLTQDDRNTIHRWLYAVALAKADGSIEKQDGFLGWQQKNQHVPTSMVYLVANLIDQSDLADVLDTAPLYEWADNRMVGWNLTWRCPDDSWLYHNIWVISAYIHATCRAPELLESENARKSFEWYRTLSNPEGIPFIFGESTTTDFLGPMVSYLLGALILREGEYVWLAERMLAQAESHVDLEGVQFRATELFWIYSLWPEDLAPTRPSELTSMVLTSPLGGRGWAVGDTPYSDSVKTHDSRFPAHGRDLHDNDDLYMERNPAAYVTEKNDKLILRDGGQDGGMIAIADLRAQGLHDHPDALGLITLMNEGVVWILESTYMPRAFNRQRWLHNVALARRGYLPPEEVLTWRSDTWREVEDGDIHFEKDATGAWAMARLRPDAFDYIASDNDFFLYERLFVFRPGRQLLIVDRITATQAGPATLGPIWHTTAEVELSDSSLRFSKQGKTFAMRVAHDCPVTLFRGEHCGAERPDAIYYDRNVTDLFWHTSMYLEARQSVCFAATFGREAWPLSITSDNGTIDIGWGNEEIRVGAFGEVNDGQTPGADSKRRTRR